ncbi:hypothetical protein R80B4_01135 [Fibrobacteres bacterium R8-0-B4]
MALYYFLSAKSAEIIVKKPHPRRPRLRQEHIYRQRGYPDFTWDSSLILGALTRVAKRQGEMLGKMRQLGFGVQREAMLNALTEEITKSSEIEGDILNSGQVRSSLAKSIRSAGRGTHYVLGGL